jgi:hypothetical protein
MAGFVQALERIAGVLHLALGQRALMDEVRVQQLLQGLQTDPYTSLLDG